jgi:1-acyl-sn-glycerol-3-phosphate acyltransferase
MRYLTTQNTYHSNPRPAHWFPRENPNLVFYAKVAMVIYKGARLAKKGVYSDNRWIGSSIDIVRALESVGGQIEIQNLDAVKNLTSPCVFIGNHMSILETFILPSLIQPFQSVTFVVKESLISYPYFGHLMRSRDPIVVGRQSPRQDLKTVLQEGETRLGKDISIVVFPQTTRSAEFTHKKFNTLGIKLAKRNQVPVVPIALKTDAWGMGKWVTDIGKIQPEKKVHICFGDPLWIQGSGKNTHQKIVDFITHKLKKWRASDAM